MYDSLLLGWPGPTTYHDRRLDIDSGIILILVILIIGFAITWSNQSQVKEVEDRQTQYTRERQAMAEHDNKSASEVDNDRNTMIETLEASITDQPEQLEKMKNIINDWADMKIKSFKDRRSWVRNPEEES